jgi:hypothetical protein
MLRTKGLSAIAVILAGVGARTNAMESHRTTEKAWQEYVRGAATRMQPVPNGLTHDWISAVFIPNATIEDLLSVVHDYGRYEDIYKPVVTDPWSLDSGTAAQEFFMVWHRHVLFVNVAMRGRYRAHEVIINSHLLPPDTGGSFLRWIYSVSQYEERDGGVYLEIEAIVSSSLRWLVNPGVNHLSVASMSTTLRQTREAVDTQQVARERRANTRD